MRAGRRGGDEVSENGRGRHARGRRAPLWAAIALPVICAALLLVAVPSALAFNDVGTDSWFHEAVEELAQAGVIGGFPDGGFHPYEQVTRAQFGAMLARALELPAGAPAPFVDVDVSDWFAGEVAALYAAGVVGGVTADRFDPDGLLTREQAATLLMRGLRYLVEHAEEKPDSVSATAALGLELSGQEIESWLGGYRDRGFVSDIHRGAVAAAFRAGIAEGYPDGRFYPFFNLTRAQAAGMLHRGLFVPLALQEVAPAPSPQEGYPTLDRGASGDLVLWVESRLEVLKYERGPVDGVFDEKTATGVMAFQKVERLDRTAVCGADTLACLLGAGVPVTRREGGGDWVEIDLTRQVLILVYGGSVLKVIPVSTGAWGMSTPTGSYRILHKSWGWERVPLGYMYSPSYFRPSYAIHGSNSVPAWPASHGCVRTPVWATDDLSSYLYIGLPVHIYY